MNADVANPLLAELDLPYPISVGRLEAGEWSSSVPDRATFEGRLGVRVGESLDDAAAALRAALADLPVELRFDGARFAPGETAAGPPLRPAGARRLPRLRSRSGCPTVRTCACSASAAYPCVMVGTPGLELAHAVDERVAVKDLERLASGHPARDRGVRAIEWGVNGVITPLRPQKIVKRLLVLPLLALLATPAAAQASAGDHQDHHHPRPRHRLRPRAGQPALHLGHLRGLDLRHHPAAQPGPDRPPRAAERAERGRGRRQRHPAASPTTPTAGAASST